MLMDREKAARIGNETVNILRDGSYAGPGGRTVTIADAVAQAKARTRSYPPGTNPPQPERRFEATSIEIVNETTLQGARRLVEAGERPVALNFAAATRPGGGFLTGARAQEESLVRSSGLFACLEGNPMYAFHHANWDAIYTDYVLYSPGVPVIRTDDGALLEEPYPCAFVTAPAPNTKELLHGNPDRRVELEPAFRSRIAKLLAVGAAHGHETIVLGAWGCGAFGGDPHLVASLFAEALDGPFRGAYRRAVFSILDMWTDHRTIGPFRQRFEVQSHRVGQPRSRPRNTSE